MEHISTTQAKRVFSETTPTSTPAFVRLSAVSVTTRTMGTVASISLKQGRLTLLVPKASSRKSTSVLVCVLPKCVY